jgi:hypothetical protein
MRLLSLQLGRHPVPAVGDHPPQVPDGAHAVWHSVVRLIGGLAHQLQLPCTRLRHLYLRLQCRTGGDVGQLGVCSMALPAGLLPAAA